MEGMLKIGDISIKVIEVKNNKMPTLYITDEQMQILFDGLKEETVETTKLIDFKIDDDCYACNAIKNCFKGKVDAVSYGAGLLKIETKSEYMDNILHMLEIPKVCARRINDILIVDIKAYEDWMEIVEYLETEHDKSEIREIIIKMIMGATR